MQIAFLILAHRNVAQLTRLVSRLGDAPVFVHYDDRSPAAEFAMARQCIGGHPRVTFVRRHRCYWGGVDIVRATLECVSALQRSGVDYDYAMLLSGQDYPIQPLDRIREFIAARRGAEFIESFALAEPNRWTEHRGSYQAMARVSLLHVQIRSRFVTLPMKRQFPRGFVPHGGSQWWCLSRDCIEFLDRFRSEAPELLRYFRNVFVPDESYFQTAIAASPFAGAVTGDDLKFAIWDRPWPPYPAVLRSTDFDRFSRSEKLFARKFDASVDASVLDLIDERLLGSPGAARHDTES